MISNASVRTDPAGNMKLDKSKRTRRIDAAVAMVMGLGRASEQVASGSFVISSNDVAEGNTA